MTVIFNMKYELTSKDMFKHSYIKINNQRK